MSYRRRIHVPGGTYHVVQRGTKQRPIFSQPEDYELFESVLQAALRSTGARLHAYCWTTEAVYLCVQIDEISLGHFMQWLKSRYARGIQRRLGERGHLFQVRYDAVIVDQKAYLSSVVHYIHYVPVLKGYAATSDEFPCSSHHAYMDTREVPWVHCGTARRQLGKRDEQASAYRMLMAAPPPAQTISQVERGMPKTPGILGGPEFAESAGHRPKRAARMTSDQITRHVCRMLDVSREDVLSKSRLRRLALARAVIAWHATVRGIATLAEISRYLGRVSSTLSKTITSYRKRQPDLFKLDAFTHLLPLAPSSYEVLAEDEEEFIEVGQHVPQTHGDQEARY
ncbi:transposase [Steroidobacter sp.]|uniref:transposase n=1 Tax=Steroidobacter sp. TaxID=1978227 RepID=UPI001A47A14F|nr:transposase [Steroidobacter sp.]MBL8271004.1 transposase [Steroidobacter sp.]